MFKLLNAIGENVWILYLYGARPEEWRDRQSLPCAELWRERLNGIGVPCGDIKGVLLSEAEPNVAALDMSEEDELKFGIFCPTLTTAPPGPITTPLTPTVALP